MNPSVEDSILTRQSLLLRLKQWDDAAGWREFFDTYWELIYNVARKAGLRDDEAQEVVQETVLGVARKIGEFKVGRERGSFKSWVLGQARWRIGDQFRARKRHNMGRAESSGGDFSEDTGTEPLHRVPDPVGDTLEKIWDEEWDQHALRTALVRVQARVSVKQFQLFDLCARQGLSVADAAKAVGTTTAAAYMAKSRVGRLMRRELAELRADLR